MLLFQNLISAVEQLWANKVRSLLTVLGIIIAVSSTIVVVAVVQGFSGYITNFLQGLGTNSMWVFPEPPPRMMLSSRPRAEMTQQDLDEVERTCTAIARMAPLVIRSVQVKHQLVTVTTNLTGTTPEYQQIRNSFVEHGRFWGPVEADNRKAVCVLGRDVLNKLEVDEGIVGQYVTIDSTRCKVIGIMERKGSFFGDSQDNFVLLPHTTALQMFPENRNLLAFNCQAMSPEHVQEARAQIVNALRRKHNLKVDQPNDFIIRSQDEILKEFGKISMAGTSILVGIVGISLLVGGIGIMNVMLVSVTERTREIGLRKAVGARRRDIMLQFLTEAVVLSLLGGFIGIVFGYAVTYFASLHPSMVNVAVPFWAVMLGVGFSAGVGVVFGLLPALKAAILQPIDALRHE
jgi:putative ABC transport system permease protein